ncbi:hypothetical protein LTR66_010373, partial [Elasticomyces elasticus]
MLISIGDEKVTQACPKASQLTAGRLAIWYALITVIFRCPSSASDLTDDSSKLCKPYLATRSYATPYVRPYYDAYVAPQVQKAQPYFDRLNREVVYPVVTKTKSKYNKYGAPRVYKAQEYGQHQWKQTLQPQFEGARQRAMKQYDTFLAPQVQKVQETVKPYYSSLKTSAMDIYELELVPAYRYATPYALRAYELGHRFAITTALPTTQWAGNTAWSFMNRKIWPKVRILYGENVEPQLVRIIERLGRYKDEKKIEAMMESVDSSSVLSTVSSTVTSVSSSIASAASSLTSSASSMVQSTESSSEVPVSAAPSEAAEADIAEKLATELRDWQEKFAKAADKGADDLRERVKEICDRQVKSQAHGVGEALIIQLEETSNSAIKHVRSLTRSVVESLPEDATDKDVESAEQSLAAEIRKAGQSIKGKAQAIREWRQGYDNETISLVKAATTSTLDVIDHIRDVGLQEIGARWARMEGVTYKDWSKYHELKKTFNEWHDEVETVASQHEGPGRAKRAAEEVEERAMRIAEDAANELGRLKEVTRWKVQARDASDDFSNKYVPAGAAKAAQMVMGKVSDVSEAIAGTSQGAVESVTSAASEKMSQLASDASAAVIGTESGVAERAASRASEVVIGTETPVVESISSAIRSRVRDGTMKASHSLRPKAASVLSAAKYKKDQVQSSMKGSPAPIHESVMSEASLSIGSIASAASNASPLSAASKSIESAASVAYEAVSGEKDQNPISAASLSVSSAASVVSSAVSGGESPLSKASKKVFGGAMAQAVMSARSIVLDDDVVDEDATDVVLEGDFVLEGEFIDEDATYIILEDDIVDEDATYSKRLQSMVAQAQDYASDLTKAVQDAMKPTTTQGSVESVTSLASERYASAIAAASSVLFGTEMGAGESMASVASDRYQAAVTAASYVIYGSPAPAGQSIVSQVSSVAVSISSQIGSFGGGAVSMASMRYDQAIDLAQNQYSVAKSRVSVQAAETPEPVHERLYASIETAYSDSMSLAREKLDKALGYTATITGAVPTSTQAPLESISSIASVRLAEGLSIASQQYTSAKNAFGAQPTPANQAYLASAQRAYYEGIGMAHDRYSAFLNAASSAISGPSPPAYQSFIDRASSAVIGTPTPTYESLLSVAQSRYLAAVAAASGSMQDLLSSASSAAGKTTKSPAQNVLDSASSQYEAAVSAAAASLASASSAASAAVFGASKGSFESAVSQVQNSAVSLASTASTAVIGSETPYYESVASQASQNWEALVSKASEQVYGSPTPFSESVMSQAGEYASQATQAAAVQYAALQELFGEMIVGREPDFTESVMKRLSVAYYTGAGVMASSASSYASDAYASASSVVSSIFT